MAQGQCMSCAYHIALASLSFILVTINLWNHTSGLGLWLSDWMVTCNVQEAPPPNK